LEQRISFASLDLFSLERYESFPRHTRVLVSETTTR
jgi:hypothetical protein